MNDFKYKYGLDRSRPPASGARRVRLILFFVLVLGVTGGIIYCLIPHETTTAKPPKDPSAAATAPSPADGEKNSGGKTLTPTDDPGTATASGADVAASPEPTNDPTPENADATGDQSGSAAPAAPENPEQQGDAPAGTDKSTPSPGAEVTEFPQKGKPWAGDPPGEQPSAPSPKPAAEADDPLLAPLYEGKTGSAGVLVIVRPGESLSRLAVRHRTTVEALRYFNKLKNDNIRIGQKLRVIPGPWRITVDKSRRELLLERRQQEDWQTFAVFPVGLGRMDSTPAAEFVISTRLRHPDWYTPDGRIIRYGDPENQLGEYFLKLAKSGAPDKPLIGYGIHGTGDESTVGKNWSHGCVRMRNRDVGLLYYLAPTGTAVRIVPGEAAIKKPEK